MRTLTIRRRLVGSFLLILALFAANQLIYIWSAQTRTETMRTLDRALRRQVLASAIVKELGDLHQEVTLLSDLQFDEPAAGRDTAAQFAFEKKLNHVTWLFRELESLTDPSHRAAVLDLRNRYAALSDLWKHFHEFLATERVWAMAYLARADPLSHRMLTEDVPRLSRTEDEHALRAKAGFDRVTRLTDTVSLLIFLVSIAVAVTVAYRVSRYLVNRLSELRRGATLIGGMHLDHRIVDQPSDEMGNLARAFNDMAGNLKEARAELTQANQELEELNKILEGRIEEQLATVRLAARIQHDLLPQEAPKVLGYDIAGRSLPAQLVGGDYYDFIQMVGDRLALCLADVTGKGLPASLLMANLQATIRGQTLSAVSAAQCLERSNTLLFRSTDPGKFATVFYSILDSSNHRLLYSNAGHNPPMLFNSKRTPQQLEAGGLILGIMEHSQFEERAVQLEPGEILVIYSDGITEAMDPNDEEFGDERLIKVVNDHRSASASQLIDKVFAAVTEFSGARPQTDDMTMVVVKRLGSLA